MYRLIEVVRKAFPVLVVVIAIALLALSSGDSKAQWNPNTPQFQPIFDFHLCNDLPDDFSGPAVLKGPPGVCTPNTAPSNNADITADFTVPYGHLAYDQSFYITAGGANETRLFGPVGGGPNEDGTGNPGGGLRSTIKLGLANNACFTTIQPDFIWWDAETNLADTIPCAGEGTNNRWLNLATDGTDLFPGQADPTSNIVTKFPDCTIKAFDPDGDGSASPVQPNWRGAGLTQVPPGGDWQMLQNIEFAPGVLQAAFLPVNPNHPFAKLDASLGYINFIILNDPTTTILQPNPISDFCTDLETQGMIKGIVGGVSRITQPNVPGSYMAQARTMSYRDADGDGIENNFDTCAWCANTDNPYTSNGVDFDMIDPCCDPDVNNAAPLYDEDADGYSNSQDWCPQVANPLPGGETDAESTQPRTISAPDFGPPQDSIGDDCDSEMGGNDTVSDGLYFSATHVDSVTITGDSIVDNDGDGWGSDADPNDNNPNIPGQMTHTPMDSAGIFVPASTDTDGDGYANLEESFMGTDSGNDCTAFSGQHDAWPSDMDVSGKADLLDLLVFKPAFNTDMNDAAYNNRVDLDNAASAPGGGNDVNLLDLLPFKPHFNVTCTFP